MPTTVKTHYDSQFVIQQILMAWRSCIHSTLHTTHTHELWRSSICIIIAFWIIANQQSHV